MKPSLLRVVLCDDLTKIFDHCRPEELAAPLPLTLCTAVGEEAGFQLACFCEEENVRVTLSLPEGCVAYREVFVESETGRLPDALLRVEAEECADSGWYGQQHPRQRSGSCGRSPEKYHRHRV